MNKNTRRARKNGYASMWDWNNNGKKITKGVCVNTDWDAPDSNKTRARTYLRPQQGKKPQSNRVTDFTK